MRSFENQTNFSPGWDRKPRQPDSRPDRTRARGRLDLLPEAETEPDRSGKAEAVLLAAPEQKSGHDFDLLGFRSGGFHRW